MTSHVTTRVARLLTVILAVIVVPAFAEMPDGVSPGAFDRIAEVEGRCPTFSWSPVPDAASHELVGYRLPDQEETADLASVDLSDADQVLYSRVPGGATAWEPELSECLAPGASYVRFVRAVYREHRGEVIEASEWSHGRFFSISPLPSAAEMEEAFSVLRRYAGQVIDSEDVEADSADTEPPPPSRRQAVPQHGQKSVSTAKTAIRGSQPDATGETYGVVGLSNSPNGAGLAAGNTNGGADLVLDGLLDGDADTVFTQAGIDRASTGELWFSLVNSDSGVLSLDVEGQIVGSGSGLTDLDGSSIATGTVSADRLQHGGFMITSPGTSGEFWKSDGVGAGFWGPDNDTTYTAGVGLELSGTEFSAVGADFTPRDTTVTTIDSAGWVGYFTSITIGADGLPVISYYNLTNGDLKVAHCSDASCSSATRSTVDSSGDVGNWTSIAIGADGLPVISHYDNTNDDLKVAHCSNASCTAATNTTVDSAGDVGRATSITIGADGLPVISYRDYTNGDLKVAHCEDVGCTTAATITTVDSGGNVGGWTSITIGADGLPVISYQDHTGDLEVAHCSDASCSSATLTTVDASFDLGWCTSITIGADGLPVISYFNETNDDLKVAHCSNDFCVPFARRR